MDWIHLTIGFLLIIVGFLLIKLYTNLKKEGNLGGLSFKLRSGGIGSIIIGFGLILSEFL